MSASYADTLFRNLVPTTMFTKGWGKPEVIKRIVLGRKEILSHRENAVKLLAKNSPPVIITQKRSRTDRGGILEIEGKFRSPYAEAFPGLLPEVAETARFKAILPQHFENEPRLKPVCLCLAGTGDHEYTLRSYNLSYPLLQKGIGTILLENPFYGSRKPKAQFRSALQYVSDLWILGGALMLESSILLNWCEKEGYGPLCIQGTSMGGFMACLAASVWPKPIGLVPCLSWSTASNVYTKGVLSRKVCWNVLKSQYYNDRVYANTIKPLLESGERHNPHRTEIHSDSQSTVYSDPDIVTDHEKMQGTLSSTDTGGIPDVPVRAAFTKLGLASVAKTYQPISDEKSKSFSKDARGELISDESGRTSSTNLLQLPSLFLNNFRKVEDVKAKSFSREGGIKRSEELRPQAGMKRNPLGCEVMDFMRMTMDDLTHLANYSRPVDPSLIISLVASYDGYVPREGVMDLKDLWPESEVRYYEKGHMTSIFMSKAYTEAVEEALERNKQKYYQDNIVKDEI